MPVIIFFPKKGRGPGHEAPKILKVPPNILGTDKATKVKFGNTTQRDSLCNVPDYFVSKKRRDLVT